MKITGLRVSSPKGIMSKKKWDRDGEVLEHIIAFSTGKP